MLNFNKIEKLIEAGFINKQKHPNENLWIYNYSQKTQFEQNWIPETIACRGLITNFENEIIARPFEKFFNLGERNINLPKESFKVFEKMDGSLGIVYFIEKKPFIATRGSFNSKQAIKANEILKQYKNLKLNPDYTYLLEIIYPENRIVVDYGKEEKLVLLAIIETKTRKELPLQDVGFPIVKHYDGIKDISKLKALALENKEGFVVKFENGFRVKVKFEEYLRLHKLMTQVSNKSIWESLKNKDTIEEILENVPDEFYNYVKKTKADLENQFQSIEKQCKNDFKILVDRKTTAEYFLTCKHPSILFAMMNQKKYDQIIWKKIKPKFEKAFFN